jgi:hypothetical protein
MRNQPYVLIIGAGIYGSHAAMTLKKLGIVFKIADKTNDFFKESSSKNQNRLHLGFHYPRSHDTRQECIDGYTKFIDTYPFAAKNVQNNYYFIDKNSIIDYYTYKHIYTYEGIPFTEVDTPNIPFEFNKNSIDGSALLTEERFIDPLELQKYFRTELDQYLIKNYDPKKLSITETSITYNNERFTHLFDCTYFQLTNNILKQPDVFYELCISFLYKQKNYSKSMYAITIMDGPFLSLYPYNIDSRVYSLTDVEYTPLIKTNNIEDVYKLKNSITDEDIAIINKSFEDKVIKYIPNFKQDFFGYGNYLSIKTKPNLLSDDRSLIYIKVNDSIHRFSGGKITGIFSMENIIKELFISQ